MKLLLLLCIVFYHYLSLSCLVYILFCFWEITFRLSLFRTAHLFCKSSFSRDRGKTLENNTKNWGHKENFREKKQKNEDGLTENKAKLLNASLSPDLKHHHIASTEMSPAPICMKSTSSKPRKMRFESCKTSTRKTENLAHLTYPYTECGMRKKSRLGHLCASVHEAMTLYERWSLVLDRSGGRHFK